EDDLRTNPNIDELLKKYSGTLDKEGDKIIWDEKISSKNVNSRFKKRPTPNPMLGTDRSLNLGGVWTESRIYKEIPSWVFSNIGRSVGSVPGPLPEPRNRFWLEMPPLIEERGAAWRVVRR
ncbi:MAG: hypothetical protein ACK5LK_01020, partial [Chthoniobacterales bacterium]